MKKYIVLFLLQLCVFEMFSQYLNDSTINKDQSALSNTTTEQAKSQTKRKNLLSLFGLGASAGFSYKYINEDLNGNSFSYSFPYYTYGVSLLTPILDLKLTKSAENVIHTFDNGFKYSNLEFNLAPLLRFENKSLTMLYVYVNNLSISEYTSEHINDKRINLSSLISWDYDYYETRFTGVKSTNITSNRFYVGIGYILNTISNIGRDLNKIEKGKGYSQQFNKGLNSIYYDNYGNFKPLRFFFPTPLADFGYQFNKIDLNGDIHNENGLFVRLGLGFVRNITIGNHILLIPNVNWIFFDKLVNENYEGVLREKSLNASLKVQIYL